MQARERSLEIAFFGEELPVREPEPEAAAARVRRGGVRCERLSFEFDRALVLVACALSPLCAFCLGCDRRLHAQERGVVDERVGRNVARRQAQRDVARRLCMQ